MEVKFKPGTKVYIGGDQIANRDTLAEVSTSMLDKDNNRRYFVRYGHPEKYGWFPEDALTSLDGMTAAQMAENLDIPQAVVRPIATTTADELEVPHLTADQIDTVLDSYAYPEKEEPIPETEFNPYEEETDDN